MLKRPRKYFNIVKVQDTTNLKGKLPRVLKGSTRKFEIADVDRIYFKKIM